MPNKKYEHGREREYRLMAKLRKEGWFCIRSSGSHTPIDIIALKRGSIRFIQSKKTGYLSPQERKEKEDLERELGIEIEVL